MSIISQMQQVEVLPNSLALWSIGQMGLGVKGPDATIFLDLCLSDYIEDQLGEYWKRAYPAPIPAEQVTNADFYFISHEHWDHLDPETVPKIAQASPQACFVTNKWCQQILTDLGIDAQRTIALEPLKPTILPGSSINVISVPAAHYELDYDEELEYRWISFLIEWNGVTLFHAGDTVIYPDYIPTLKKLPAIDIAILPVNGRDYYRETVGGAIGNLLPAEAAQLAQELGVDTLIVGHNDMYANNAIPYSEIVAAIEQFAPGKKYKILRVGELYYYLKTA
jgi:L-ascorbate metabolism protein UlaG (beta-lactamase superfamily)